MRRLREYLYEILELDVPRIFAADDRDEDEDQDEGEEEEHRLDEADEEEEEVEPVRTAPAVGAGIRN
jgi:hypothetical protein